MADGVRWDDQATTGTAPPTLTRPPATTTQSPTAGITWDDQKPQPAPALKAPSTADHSTLGDLGRRALGAAATGAGELVQAYGDIGKKVEQALPFTATLHRAQGITPQGVQDVAKGIESYGANESANVSPEYAKKTSVGLTEPGGLSLTNLADKAVTTVAGMAPALAGTVAASALGGPAAGVAAGSTLFGLQGEAAGRNAGEQQVAALTDQQLQQIPAYQNYLKAGLTPEQARAKFGEDVANRQALVSGGFGAGLGLVGEIPGVNAAGKAIASKLTRPIGARAAQAIGKGAAEGAGFAGINAAGQVVNNVTNPIPTPATQGVGEAAASGLLPGFVLGGARGVLTRPQAQAPEPNPGAAPGSLSDAANVLQRAAPDAQALAGSETPTSTTEAQSPITRKMPPPPVPWINTETGEQRTPTASEVVAAFHRMQDDQAQADANNVKLVTGLSQLSDAWGVPLERLKSLRRVAISDRAKGVTTADAEQRAAEDVAQQQATDARQQVDRDLFAGHGQPADEAAPPPAPTDAGVPFMITRTMRADLAARGFSDDAIAHMTPQDAHAALAAPEATQPMQASAAETRVAPADQTPTNPKPPEDMAAAPPAGEQSQPESQTAAESEPRALAPDKLDAIVQRWRENQGEPDAKDVATIAQMYRVPIGDVKAARDRTNPNNPKGSTSHAFAQESQSDTSSSAPRGTGGGSGDEAPVLPEGEGRPAARTAAAETGSEVGGREAAANQPGEPQPVATPPAAAIDAARVAPESGEPADAGASQPTVRPTKAPRLEVESPQADEGALARSRSERSPDQSAPENALPTDQAAGEPPAPSVPASEPAGPAKAADQVPSSEASNQSVTPETTANVGEKQGTGGERRDTTAAIQNRIDPISAFPQADAHGVVTTRMRDGRIARVLGRDLASGKEVMRMVDATGAPIPRQRVHVANLDPTGEKRAALAKQTADNPLDDVIGRRKDGAPFASQHAAQRELNRQGLSESHVVVKAATLKPGAEGYVVLNKRYLAKEAVDTAARESAAHPENEHPEPTPAQQEAGNFKSGHVNLHGLDVTIQVPKGGLRRGTDRTGKAWERAASDHYGHIRRTEGADGEPVDVYLGPHAEDPKANVFVIDQVKPGTKTFDEHKAMVGFKTGREARASYDRNFPKGLKTFGGIRKMSMDAFKDWVKHGDTTKPASEAPLEKSTSPSKKQLLAKPSGFPVGDWHAVDEQGNVLRKVGAPDGMMAPRFKSAEQADAFARKQLAASATTPEKPRAIEDFGEKLGGARKDQAPSLREELGADDIRTQPLSKIWPATEVDAITDPFAAAVAFATRAEVPAKPRTGYKLDRWVEKVQAARSLARHAVEGRLTPETLATRSMLKDFAAKVKLLQAIDRSQWKRIGDVRQYPDAYAYGPNGEHIPKPSVMVSIDGRWEKFEGAKSIDDAMSAVKQKLGTAAPEKKLQFEIRGNTRKGDYFINKKGDGEYRRLKTFTDLAEARAYLKANHADLVQAWEAVKDRDNVTKADMRNEANRERVGPDYRDGKDVTPEQFGESFGFRGVEFGNWVKQGGDAKERQGLLNQAYDALMDLANLIGVPPRAISLDGSLGLGLGSRGHGWASAHFESDRLVINLTKTRGAGALAHEWFHALDNYFARSRATSESSGSRQPTRQGAFVTYRPEPRMVNKTQPRLHLGRDELMRRHALQPDDKFYNPADWQPDPNHPAGVRPVVEKAFADLVKALNDSPMAKRAATIDKGKTDGYWSRIIERAARSFENYVIARMEEEGLSNDYLANVRKLEAFNRNPERYPYLRPEELKPVAEAFDNLFNTVETRKSENGNVALFSRPEPRLPDDPVPSPDGGLNFGEIGKDLANSIRRQGGKIRLPLGEQRSNGTGFGRVHIESNHGAQIRNAGFKSVEDFVHHIAQHPDQIWRAPVGQLVLLARGKPPGVMFLRMQPARDAEGDYYRVNTAFPVRHADYGTRKGWEKLWDGSEPPSSATGTRTAFAATPGSESSPGRPNAVRQSSDKFITNGKHVLDRQRVQKMVDATTTKWRDNQPRVRVVEDAEGLPASAKADPGYKTAEGYYDPKTGTAYLVASNLTSPRRAMEVLAHEAIGHHGVEHVVDTAFGAGAWQKIEDAIGRLDKGGKASDAMRSVLQETHRRYAGANPETFAKEFLAVSAEKGVRNTFLDRVVTAIRKFLRQIMPHLQLNERELRQALVQAERYVRESTPYRERVAQKAAMAFSSKPDTFYSALTEAVAIGKGAPKKADSTTWKQWLDGAQRRGEFKAAEREWMGVDQWLDEHKGPVTRAELNGFVRDNQVRVQEVVRRDEIPVDEAAGIHENDDGTFELVDHEGAVGESTKFGEYTLPGGKNYRELLLTLPERDALTGDERTELGRLTERKQTVELGRPGVKPLSAEETARMRALQDKAIAGNKAPFHSNHFDEPNIIAHVRMNDRTGPDGEKILHVEEVQSDWHQAGRKGGYFDPNKPWEVFRLRDGEPAGQFATESDAKAEAQRLGREFDYARGNEGGDRARVPNAPFKKEWPMLAMKRVLRYAADHGYDRVTWATGEQQAARYDLSKQVHSVTWKALGPDSKQVAIDVRGGDFIKVAVGPDGRVRGLRGQEPAPQFDGQRIGDVLGKDLGDRIMANAEGKVSGDGLKVGGQGMHAFYDKMLPNELNKYVKQWGAKVAETRIGTAREHEMATALRERGYDPATVTDQQILSDNGGRRPMWLTDDDLEAIRDGSVAEVEPMRADVHSIDITPAMRESVQRGQPLFSKRDEDKATDPSREPHKTVKDIEAVLRDGDPSGMRDKAKAWLRGKFEDFRPAMLGALQTRHVLELMEDSPPLKGSGRNYERSMQQMDADRQQLMAGAPDAAEHPNDMLKKGAVTIAQEMRQFAYGKGLGALRGRVRPEAQKLFDMMHAATMQRMDPDKAYERLTIENAHGDAVPWTHEEVKARLKLLRELALQRGGDAWADREKIRDEIKYLRNLPKMERNRERNWPKLQADWQALPEEAKGLYRQVRDWYSQYRDETEKALIKNIEALDMPETYRRSLVNRMRLRFEEARREGVYFPLNRDGAFWIAFRDIEGNEGFKMFESARDFERGEKRLRAAGFQIDAKGRRDQNMKAQDAPSGTFVRQVIDVLQQAKVSEGVQDEVYQTFLRSLPELSMRKHAIHRKNIAGYSEDALRAFAKNGYHGAHQLARLRHAQDMGFALEAMKASVDNWRRGENSTDTMKEPNALEVAKADALVGEMAKRHEWIMHPTDQRLANMVNSVGFIYYLGASPSSALTNLTQVAQTVLPVLGAEHGWGKATRMLGAAWRDAARTVGHMDRTLKDPDERRAFMVMQQRGDFSKTQSHTLAGLAEGNVLQTSPVWSRTMNAISWMFHTAEVINREATGMAAYRLARAKGMDFNKAVEYAGETNANANFDYAAANRPRYMQGNVQRIALQFKNYSVGMSWLFYRNLFQAMKGETPEIRRVARRTVTGILGMTAILAGSTGLPVYNAVRMTANAANALWGDDNEPWNFDDAFHRWLGDNLGPDAARLIAEGPTNYLTGANVASRTSMANLWIHDDDQRLEGADAYHALLENLAGPIGGIVNNWYVGAEDVRRGHLERGVERMLPTAVKNSIKSLRYAHEGVNSLRGDPIVPDVSGWQEFLQAIGFQPAAVADQYRINTAMKNYTGEIGDRRINLMNAYALALKAGDDGDTGTVLRKISAFNQAHPEVAITAARLRASLRQRARLSAQATNGVVLNRRLALQAQQYAGVAAQ